MSNFTENYMSQSLTLGWFQPSVLTTVIYMCYIIISYCSDSVALYTVKQSTHLSIWNDTRVDDLFFTQSLPEKSLTISPTFRKFSACYYLPVKDKHMKLRIL